MACFSKVLSSIHEPISYLDVVWCFATRLSDLEFEDFYDRITLNKFLTKIRQNKKESILERNILMSKKIRCILTVFPLIFLSMVSSKAADDQGDWKIAGKKSRKEKKPEHEKIRFEAIEEIREVAENITKNIPAFNSGMRNVMNDHSKEKHKQTDSYFYSSDREEIEKLIKETVSSPDSFLYEEHKNRRGETIYRLSISKTFEYPIGHDEKYGEMYRLVACFGVGGVSTILDSKSKGVFLTAFPARKDFNMGCK